jgi:hypothetical protein
MADSEITLQIYQAASGQWSGIFVTSNEEIGRIGGCESPEEVEELAVDSGMIFESVQLIKIIV